MDIPYVLESNPHPFYSFRGLKNQMQIRIECGLDSRSRAGFWKNANRCTNFFSFKKVAKIRCGLDSRIYGSCNLAYYSVVCLTITLVSRLGSIRW
jgi:hypothetical protein